MRTIVGENVQVVAVYDGTNDRGRPVRIKWGGKTYAVSQVGFYHPVRQGRRLLHIFSVTNGTLAFKLEFDTESRLWTLLETSDGLAD